MTGITSVGSTVIQQYYVSNAVSTGSGTSATTTTTNSNRQLISKEAASLNEAAQDLKNRLKAFANDSVIDDLFEDGNTSSSFQVMVRDSLANLAKSYNKFNEVLKSSKYMTGEGSKLLDQVHDLLTGKNAVDYSKMGLELNKQTGELKFNDKKFMTFIDENPLTARKLLMGNNYVASLLQNVSQSVLNKQTGYYFVSTIDVSI